jgi:hypothetical protein
MQIKLPDAFKMPVICGWVYSVHVNEDLSRQLFFKANLHSALIILQR